MPTLDELSEVVLHLVEENEKLRQSVGKLVRRMRTNNLSNPTTALSRDLVDLGEVPYAKMYQTSSQTLTTATWTTITMDAFSQDTMGGGVDLANEHIIIRRTGIYLIMGLVHFAADTTGARFAGISVNSIATPNFRFFGFDPTGDPVRVGPATMPALLNVGDTIELMGWHGRGIDLDTAVTDSADTSWLAALLVAND